MFHGYVSVKLRSSFRRIAAYFVQQVVSTYETHHAAFPDLAGDAEGEEQDRGKECSNLIVLLSELYNFQVVSSVLIFDIVRSLLKDISEFSVELLLKVLRSTYLSDNNPQFTLLKYYVP